MEYLKQEKIKIKAIENIDDVAESATAGITRSYEIFFHLFLKFSIVFHSLGAKEKN